MNLGNLIAMTELELLEVGYINEVYKLDGQVFKYYKGEDLVGIPASQRAIRESILLKKFGGKVDPNFAGKAEKVTV